MAEGWGNDVWGSDEWGSPIGYLTLAAVTIAPKLTISAVNSLLKFALALQVSASQKLIARGATSQQVLSLAGASAGLNNGLAQVSASPKLIIASVSCALRNGLASVTNLPKV